MKNIIFILVSFLTSFILMNVQDNEDAKPFVDYNAFGKLVQEVEQHRAERLISLDDFLEKSKESNTIILDTRSKSMYDLKHVKGAIHLNFSDFTQFSLDQLFAEYAAKNTQILIYCNNNFTDIGKIIQVNKLTIQDMDIAFMSKSAAPEISSFKKLRSKKIKTSSVQPENITPKTTLPQNNALTLALNIPTYINLFGYGYKNVFELNELVDVKDSRIEFEGSFDNL